MKHLFRCMSSRDISCYPEWIKISNSPSVKRIFQLFQLKGHGIRIVGGAVRDVLQNKQPKDVDFATTAHPNEMIDLFEKNGIKYIPTGLQHGTITALVDNVCYEVTTLRTDVQTDGRHAIVEFTDDFKADATRRDLTVNAMGVDHEGILYDYYHGFHHLKDKTVLFVGNPADRIKEDYLRILRYFRFFGRISDSRHDFDASTIEAISDNRNGLKSISRERIWLEMQKIVVGNHAYKIIIKMRNIGLLDHIDLGNFGNLCFDDFKRVHETGKRADMKGITLLSYLFHGTDDISKICKTWKMSSDEEYIGQFIKKHKHAVLQEDHLMLKYFKDLVVDTPKHCRHKLMMGLKELSLSETSVGDNLYNQIQEWDVPVFPIKGTDLINELSIPKGPLIQKYLMKGKEKWKKEGYDLEREDILKYLKKDVK